MFPCLTELVRHYSEVDTGDIPCRLSLTAPLPKPVDKKQLEKERKAREKAAKASMKKKRQSQAIEEDELGSDWRVGDVVEWLATIHMDEYAGMSLIIL